MSGRDVARSLEQRDRRRPGIPRGDGLGAPARRRRRGPVALLNGPAQSLAQRCPLALQDGPGLDERFGEQLRVIVAQGHEDMKVIRKQIQPQVEDLLTRSEVKVRVILRPDQQEKFDKLIAERKAQWAESNGG